MLSAQPDNSIFNSAVPGQRHLDQGHDGTPVGTIVVGKQQAGGIGFLHEVEERAQAGRIIHVRRQVTGTQENLGSARIHPGDHAHHQDR
jgi:hypothetical protein